MLPTTDDPLTVHLIGDDPLARAGLATLIQDEAALELVAATPATGPDPIPPPDVRLWDLGPRGIPETPAPLDGVPILALVSDEDQAAQARAAGARGLIHRDDAHQRLAPGLVAVAAGLHTVDEAYAIIQPDPVDPAALGLRPLSPREYEVLELMAEGHANRDIALALDVTEHTVKFHVRRVLDKLGAATRTEAVVQAIRGGMLEV